MKAIFAYKILENFWKPKDEYFWQVANLSVSSASNFYTTVLCSDLHTKKVFDSKGIKFDEFVDCTELFHKVTEHSYGVVKMLVMLEQTNPYLLLDLDTVLLSSISSTKQVAFGYKEVNMVLNSPVKNRALALDYLEEYYSLPYERFTSISSLKLKNIDWNTCPSHSLVLINSPKLAAQVCNKILKALGETIYTVPPTYTVQFYEQFLFYNILNELGVELDFIYETLPSTDLAEEDELLNIYCLKFLHLDSYLSEKTRKLVDILVKK